jgi:microcystin-dependent protein
MTAANPLWGAPRIHGELCKLRIAVSERIVSRPFLTNHVSTLVSMDSFTVPTLTGRVLFVLVLLAHQRRSIIHLNITEHPTAGWTAQQIVEAFPDDTALPMAIANKRLIDAGASGSYGAISGSANFKSNEDVTRAVKETFSHDWTGDDWSTIPKTVNVYQVNSADFDSDRLIRSVQLIASIDVSPESLAVKGEFPSLDSLAGGTAAESGADGRDIGSIVFSVLDEKDFQARNGQEWVLCDGRLAAGSKYGALTKQPNIPNCKGRVLLGADNMGGVPQNLVHEEAAGKIGEVGGKPEVRLGVNNLPPHGHTQVVRLHEGPEGKVQANEYSPVGPNGLSNNWSWAGSSTQDTGGGVAFSILPPFVTVNIYIKIN